MKKTKKTRLHVTREVLRALQSHELRQIEGGNAASLFDCPPPPLTGDSKVVCCA